MGQTACPIASGTPKVVYSAFTKEQDLFAKQHITYVEDALDFDNIILLKSYNFV